MSDGPLALWLDVASDAVVLACGVVFLVGAAWWVLSGWHARRGGRR